MKKRTKKETDMQRIALVPCFSCHTTISLVLDLGPSAFQCPICSTFYIIDPLERSGSAAQGLGCTVTQVDGHRLEVFFGTGVTAQRIQSSLAAAQAFFGTKVGGMKNAFVANTYSAPGKGLG